MFKFSLTVAGFVLALAGAPVALAEEAAPAENGATATEDSGEKVICKRIDTTGSRLRREKICRTANEWAAESEDSDDAMRRLREQGANPGRVDPGPTVAGQ